MCAQTTKADGVKVFQRYPINQSRLYKVGSRAKLAGLLYIDKTAASILAGGKNYKIFTVPEHQDPYSGKVKKKRIVQDPKRTLRRIHDRILNLLNRVEIPDYVHAAVKGRSYRSNAAVHTTMNHEVATFDIKAFYPSVSSLLVRDFFRFKLKCAPDVADMLADLCTFEGALPTGSPLSPLLSYFACADMFESLHLLAKRFDLKFTCYIDDLTYSGTKIPGDLESNIKSILRRYGLILALKKSIRYEAHAPKSVTGCILHNGAVHVPHNRFRKARALAAAISVSTDLAEQHKLRERLAGLLGEAAYLDARYVFWKENTSRLLRASAKKIAAAQALSSA